MHNDMKRTRVVPLAAIAILGLSIAGLFPLPETVVPEWKIRIAYPDGRAASGVSVFQSWKDYSVEPDNVSHRETAITDAEGVVTFPARDIRSPILLREIGSLLNRIDFFSGRSYGKYSYVWVDGYASIIRYEGGDVLPDQMSLHEISPNPPSFDVHGTP